MNERIKALALQAGVTGYFAAGTEYATPIPLSDEVQKFAEMIVKECMDIVSKQTTLDTNEDFREGFSHGRKLAWTEIRKHFGVEE
jgi:hypothetical protein